MNTIILCGGRGIRLGNESDYIPKAMVKLGHRPIIWHIMKRYSLAGYNSFVLALGKKGELVRDYFTRYTSYTNDVKINLGTGTEELLTQNQESNWGITFVDTGDSAMSGARIARCKQYIDDEFMVTYSDCLANLDIKKLIEFHRKSKKIATVLGVVPPYREGQFTVEHNLVTGFYDSQSNKNEGSGAYVNGGYMVFNKKIFSYINSFNECRLETDIFSQLIKDKQLAIFSHTGFWRWLDTDRDYEYLNELVDKNKTYWLQDKIG